MECPRKRRNARISVERIYGELKDREDPAMNDEVDGDAIN